jgi:hypothetical protein
VAIEKKTTSGPKPTPKKRGPYKRPVREVAIYVACRQRGMFIKQSAKEAGLGYEWAKNNDEYLSGEAQVPWRNLTLVGDEPPEPVPLTALKDIPMACLDDFELFRARYFGHISMPWQIEAAEMIKEMLATDDKEFVVINVAPGSGKTTLFNHDIPAWLIVRNRAIRCLFGSKGHSLAEKNTYALRRTLERRVPEKATDEDIVRGLATDATATLDCDYGPFRPPADLPDIWTRNQYVVWQHDDRTISEKESTVTAFGQDQAVLGMRVDFAIWDDLVDKQSVLTPSAIEKQRDFYDTEAETRLEPGGLIVLQGQRLHPDDLYRHVIDKPAFDQLDEEELESAEFLDLDTIPKKYTHIVYKAHDEARCEGVHKPDEAVPWPDGCLLDPRRLPYKELRSHRASNAQRYATVYQQEDVDLDDVLIPKIWITGGVDNAGIERPGCYDKDRGMGELPENIGRPLYSIITADPSPTKYWGIQWWIYHPETEQRFLMNLKRQRMDAPDFLDYIGKTDSYVGLLEEWWLESKKMGVPVTDVIVEHNAAQRFLLQYNWAKSWMSRRKVRIIPHTTHSNKADPEFGIQMLRQPYEFGLARLPYRQDGPHDPTRLGTLKLVEELTRYPHSVQDDLLMANWFMEHNLGRIAKSGYETIKATKDMPSWVTSDDKVGSIASLEAAVTAMMN